MILRGTKQHDLSHDFSSCGACTCIVRLVETAEFGGIHARQSNSMSI